MLNGFERFFRILAGIESIPGAVSAFKPCSTFSTCGHAFNFIMPVANGCKIDAQVKGGGGIPLSVTKTDTNWSLKASAIK